MFAAPELPTHRSYKNLLVDDLRQMTGPSCKRWRQYGRYGNFPYFIVAAVVTELVGQKILERRELGNIG